MYDLQGGSSLAWIQVPDVPSLCDSSAVLGVSSELDSAIVIHSGHCIWTFIQIRAVFAVWVLQNHHAVIQTVAMCNAVFVLAFVVLEDKLLLAFLDVFPVGLKGNV